jgi:hypothetical protein
MNVHLLIKKADDKSGPQLRCTSLYAFRISAGSQSVLTEDSNRVYLIRPENASIEARLDGDSYLSMPCQFVIDQPLST